MACAGVKAQEPSVLLPSLIRAQLVPKPLNHYVTSTTLRCASPAGVFGSHLDSFLGDLHHKQSTSEPSMTVVFDV